MADKIPPELLEYIFLYVKNPSDLFNIRVVCKKWHALISNERFLTLYFRNRCKPLPKQSLNWFIYKCSSCYPPRPDSNVLYPTPINLQGTGGIVLDHYTACRAPIPIFIFPLINHDYSIGMWLHFHDQPYLQEIKFFMYLNDFSLKFILGPTSFRLVCSHIEGLEAQASIHIPLRRWMHVVLTYSSKFRLYINGHAYSLSCIERSSKYDPFSYNMSDYYNEHFILSYEAESKFFSMAKFADIQILPCALTLNEIRAINKQNTCIEELNMGRYLLDYWANINWYSKYLFNCTLF